MKQEKTM
jgi:hypothetical protein